MKKIMKKFLPLLLFLASFCQVQAGSNELNTRYPHAIAFIQKEMCAAGLDPRFIGITPSDRWNAYWNPKEREYQLSIPQTGRFSLKELENLLAHNGDTAPYQFVIAHEINHLWGNHATKRAAIQIIKDIGVTAAALATHALIYCKSKNLSAAQHLALHTIAAVLEYCAFTKNPAVYAYIRSLEQEADDYVRNDIKVLKGGITFLEAHKTQEAPASCLKWIKKLLSTHPEISTRVAKLQERIKALEQKA